MKVKQENKINEDFPERWYFYCPGCKLRNEANGHSGEDARMMALHVLNVETVHKFNRDSESPTFEPSLMAHCGAGNICHSYIRGGNIEFLSDSNHPLSGRTVPLPEIEDGDPYSSAYKPTQ